MTVDNGIVPAEFDAGNAPDATARLWTTFEARFGTNTVWGPAVVTDRTWACDFGHCVATGGERASVRVWDDVDGNGLWDEGECSNRYDIAAASHDTVVAEPLAYRNFDRDGDDILDWWEVRYAAVGLSPTNAADALLDPDGDGLINLHEFWAGTNPSNHLDNAAGTLLRAAIDGVDDRLSSISDPVGKINKFRDYRNANGGGNVGVFTSNANFWLEEVDTSCASMWNGFPWPGGFRRAGTLVSRRHVVFANHFPAIPGCEVVFWGNDGNAYTNVVIATNSIHGTDIQIGILASNMPVSVSSAKILPTNYGEYIRSMSHLPVVQFDYDENALVFEIEGAVSAYVHTTEPQFHNRRKVLHHNIVIGDSGNPAFLVIGDTAVLLGCLHTGNHATSGGTYTGGGIPFLTYRVQDLQDAMDRLCPGFTLEFLDLSPYQKLPIRR